MLPDVRPYTEALRILVIEDSDSARERIVGILTSHAQAQHAQFAITEAATYEGARDALISEYFDFAIVDLVLHGGPTGEIEEWEGFWLLQDLFEMGLQEETAVVVLTSFDIGRVANIALTRFKALIFLSKEQSSDDIVDSIAELLEEQHDCGMRCNLTLAEPETWRELVLRLGRGQFGRLTSPVSVGEAEVELNHLVRRLERSATDVHLTPMEGGHSGAAVARVTRHRDGVHLADVIIKYGLAPAIHEEQQRYRKVSDLVSDQRLTQLNQVALGRNLGVLEYTLVGADPAQVRPFGEFYRHASAADVRRCVEALFERTCGRWYANRRAVSGLSLSDHYAEHLGFSRATLAREYAFKFGDKIIGRETIRHVELPRDLPDPVTAVTSGAADVVCDTWVCPSHGDMHGGNILVDGPHGEPWLIDFAAAGEAHWARDFAALECCVKFQYTDAAHDLGGLYELESVLADSESLSEGVGSRVSLQRADLAKALRAASDIRQVMAGLVGDAMSERVMYREYHAALLYQSLNYLRFHSLLKKQKARKHHVLAAAALAYEVVMLGSEAAPS